MKHLWNDTDQKKLKYTETNLPNTRLFNVDHIWTEAGSNPSLCGENWVTNHLSHGTVTVCPLFSIKKEKWSLKHLYGYFPGGSKCTKLIYLRMIKSSDG